MTPQREHGERDHRDDAIDHVAKRMTHVDDDEQFTARIVASLPERSNWFGWLTHSWAPGLAMIAIVVGAVALWNVRHTTEVAPASQPIAGVQLMQPQAQFAAAIEPAPLEPVRTKPLEPWNPGTVEPFVGLPSIAAPNALAMNDVAPKALPSEDALSLPSLVIADLPLTGESFSERD